LEEGEMVTWTDAFKAAAKIVLYALAFYVIGSIIIAFGVIGALSSLQYGRFSSSSFLMSLLTYFVGIFLIALGGVAAMLKVQTEMIVEEVRKSNVVPVGGLRQPTGLRCASCGTMNGPDSKFCFNCGRELTGQNC